jgi:hypothetical protein
MGLFSFGSNAVRFSLQVLALFGLLRNIIYLDSHLFPVILAVSQKTKKYNFFGDVFPF